ncbi:unnamed protein product [Protopolystoma xenopodis]|uniref:Uncharacterized protein n=1 Tax=Protopolystoma xenopodis TaxID=117903 RepID=A0A3S5CBK0_9PLAT|nr:unnamed protein product [Protopolystoma xenopodis]
MSSGNLDTSRQILSRTHVGDLRTSTTTFNGSPTHSGHGIINGTQEHSSMQPPPPPSTTAIPHNFASESPSYPQAVIIPSVNLPA